MPDRNGLTILADLPGAIIFGEILVRLPAKDVFRCRAVHKSWRSGTLTTNFLNDHHRLRPKHPIIFISKLSDGDSVPDLRRYVVCPNDTVGTVGRKLLRILPPGEGGGLVLLHAARDGLLIVSYQGVFWVYNPATHQVAHIPQLRPWSKISIVGFYRHHATGEYRIVYWHHSADVYSILTLGSDAPPRRIRYPPPSVLSFSFPHALTETLPYSFGMVLHRENLHWYDTGGILVFCTTVETFRRMRGPVQESMTACLLEMEGTLAMCGNAEGLVINIWVMQDYMEEIWEPKYRINLLVPTPRWPLRSLQMHGLFKVAVVNEREILVQFPDADLKLFDIDGKLVGNTRSGAEFWSLTSHFFQENIIPLPLFEMQDHGTNIAESPSSTTMYAICYRTILHLVSRCGWAMFFLMCVVCWYFAY